VPELGLIRAEAVAGFSKQVDELRGAARSDADRQRIGGALVAQRIIRDHPEVTGAVWADLTIPHSDRVNGMLGSFYLDTMDTVERGEEYRTEGWMDGFVHLHTNALYVDELRAILKSHLVAVKGGRFALQGSSLPNNIDGRGTELFAKLLSILGKPGQTVAEILTGTKTPWLPERNWSRRTWTWATRPRRKSGRRCRCCSIKSSIPIRI